MNFLNNNNNVFMRMDGFNVKSEGDIKIAITEALGELEHFSFRDGDKTYNFIPDDSYMYSMRIDDENNYLEIELAIGGVDGMIKKDNMDYFKNLISFVNYYKSRCTIGSLLTKDEKNLVNQDGFDLVVTYRVISPDIKNKQGIKNHIARSVKEIDDYLLSTLDVVYES